MILNLLCRHFLYTLMPLLGAMMRICICIKTDTFSARAWRGHDCVLIGLKTLLLANFQRVERLKQEKVT